jgi:hypothetical protein
MGPEAAINAVYYNKIQSAGSVFEIQNMEPLADKWTAFGFRVFECNGHDIDEAEPPHRVDVMGPDKAGAHDAHADALVEAIAAADHLALHERVISASAAT